MEIPLQPVPATLSARQTTLNLTSTLQNLEQDIGPDVIDRIVAYPNVGPGKSANAIRTSKYTFLTFLPLNLFGQFKRFYNVSACRFAHEKSCTFC
jgi:hypothetical protein